MHCAFRLAWTTGLRQPALDRSHKTPVSPSLHLTSVELPLMQQPRHLTRLLCLRMLRTMVTVPMLHHRHCLALSLPCHPHLRLVHHLGFAILRDSMSPLMLSEQPQVPSHQHLRSSVRGFCSARSGCKCPVLLRTFGCVSRVGTVLALALVNVDLT